jgi:hypothetical protein
MTDPNGGTVTLDPEYVFFAAATTARLMSAKPVHLVKEVEGHGPVADIAEYERYPELLQSDVELLLTGAFAVAERFGIDLDVPAAERGARAAREGAKGS